MNKDNENQARFIPCGDALEKMNEISGQEKPLGDEQLEDVSGGMERIIPTYRPVR